MCLSRSPEWLGLAVFLAVASAGLSQQYAPHVAYVYPAGGQRGTSFQVKLGGQFLDGTTNVYVSGKGVQAKVLETAIPLTQQQADALRQKLEKLLEKIKDSKDSKDPKDPKVLKEIADIRMKLENFEKRGKSALAETVTVEITMAPDAEPGEREVRLRTGVGLSNPLVFHVGQLPEFYKTETSSSPPPAPVKPPKKGASEQKPVAPGPEMRITQPAVINGQILPGGVDRFRFPARQGQQLVIAASARALVPYLADAVPGWFQATLALYDPRGNELAYDDHYSYHPDPVLYYKIPSDGDYVMEIRDALYRGREDFVYRIALGELPFVTRFFPLGGKDRDATPVKLEGWNLPSGQLTVEARDKKQGTLPLFVRNDLGTSNRVPFAVDSFPECQEQEPNNDQARAQQVSFPIIINGRIDPPGDWDVFRFEGRPGEEIVAEVNARRLDSPLDSVLKLTDAAGREVAFNDDNQDKRYGLHTHHADSLLMARLPAKGTYYLHLGDAQNQGGPAYAYRLRISGPRPDFALRVVPSSISARPGTCVPFTVFALRKEGFNREIALELKNPPQGFFLGGARIPANQDQVRMTLAVPATAPEEPVNLWLEGVADIQGQRTVRQAVPAEDMMQAFIYHHLVPARTLVLAVTGRGRFGAPLKLLREEPVKLVPGGNARVGFVLSSAAAAPLERAQLTLNEPPEGITIQKVETVAEGLVIHLEVDANKAKPGLQGNLIIDANVEVGKTPVIRKPKIPNRRVLVSTLPAIPFQIVGKKR